MPFLEDALEKFELLDPEVIFIVNSDRFLNPIRELSAKYKVEFDDIVILMVTGDLSPNDLVDYMIQEKEMEEASAKAAAVELKKFILEPLSERLMFMSNDPDRDKESIRLEKDHLNKIFRENLLVEFAEHPFIRNALNFKLFDLFERDFSLKMELERSIYENKELLTSEKIKINNRDAEPTIGNWIKDFIQKKGNDNFNTVVLSDYLANSQNTIKLSMEDRAKLAELLLLYQNLRFFEAMTKGKKIDDWRIFPVSLSELKKPVSASEDDSELDEPSLDSKLAGYDWEKMNKLEIMGTLEELGVSQKEFKEWQKSQ